MSLQHLLAAITEQATSELAAYKRASDERLSAAKARQKASVVERTAAIGKQVEDRKTLLRAKAETHAQLSRRASVLQARQRLIDEIFDAVLAAVGAVPEQKIESLLKRLLTSMPKTGTIRPAKKHAALIQKLLNGSELQLGEPINATGGFVFESETIEKTCTFEHLISNELRSQKELWVSRELSLIS